MLFWMHHLSAPAWKRIISITQRGKVLDLDAALRVSVYFWFQIFVQQRGTAYFWPLSASVKSWDLQQSQVAWKLNNLKKSSARLLAQHLPKVCSGTEKRLPQSEGAFPPCKDRAEGSGLCLREGLATTSAWRLKVEACCQEEKAGESW